MKYLFDNLYFLIFFTCDLNIINIIIMSYIICSNIESDDLVKNGASASPSSFTNFFKSPLIIEPNSEVAIESVKMTRSDEYEIKDNDTFFIYFGEEQSTTRTSGDCAKNGVRIQIPAGYYTLEQMRSVLQKSINSAPLGPEIFGNCAVDLVGDTDKTFKNFKFSFSPRQIQTDKKGDIVETDFELGNGASIKCSIDGYKKPTDTPTPTPPFSYDDTTQVLSSNVASPNEIYHKNQLRSYCCARMRFNPLSAVNGDFHCEIKNASQSAFRVGLSRPTTAWHRNGFPSIIGGLDGNSGFFGSNIKIKNEFSFLDYWVEWDPDQYLKIFSWNFQLSNAKTGAGYWTPKEINYWETTMGAELGKITSTVWETYSLEQIKFNLKGNQLRIGVYSSKGSTNDWDLVNSEASGDRTRSYNFAPIGNSQEALFPVFVMTANTQSFKITKYMCDTFTNWKHIDSVSKNLLKSKTATYNNMPVFNNGLIAGSDWYSNAELFRNVADELRYNQLRPALRSSGTGISTEFPPYTLLTADNTIDYKVVFVVGEEYRSGISDYDQILYVIPLPPNRANLGRVLGFDNFNIISIDTYGEYDTGVSTINGINNGVYKVESAFIRINDLPIQSFNGATNSRSNILYHIPKFSNDGRQYGELYFNAPEKTYLKLNNTDKIMLNQLTIDIVSRNERVVGDLQGATIVALHIRKIKN